LQVAAVESEEQVAKPSVLCVCQTVEDRMEEQLAEVVDGIRDQRGDGEVVCDPLSV